MAGKKRMWCLIFVAGLLGFIVWFSTYQHGRGRQSDEEKEGASEHIQRYRSRVPSYLENPEISPDSLRFGPNGIQRLATRISRTIHNLFDKLK
ncbi:MAG: hypothetical protein JW934_08610 [Anaerolineae bacterium]|nr:hypothetical protein [Anaerolineae bacterium]